MENTKTTQTLQGKKAPSFKLPATGDKNLSLSDFKGRNLILYFYPKDDTPGCVREGEAFRDLYSQIKKQGAEVLGVSKDSISSHEKFKAKYNYPFDLLSDEKGIACKAFEVIKKKTMFGKTSEGIARSTFLISDKGLVIKEWRNVKVDGHAQKVLDALKASD